MQTVSDTQLVSSDARHLRGRILVLDADEGIARTLAAILRHDGYEAAVARTAIEAIAHLRAASYELLLSDSHFEQGPEPISALVRAAAPDLTIVVMTRASALETALEALHAGAVGYLLKPVDIAELRLSVARGLEHRRLERELEQAREHIRGLDAQVQRQLDDATGLRGRIEALDEANRKLHDAQTEHDQFVAMVAHELRGPLNPIINYAQIAKRPAITAEMRDRYMDIIVEHAFRLNRLVDDLQTATRLSTGHFTLRRKWCDVAAVVDEIVESFRATVHHHAFSLERPEGPVQAEIDPDRVGQAVRNLMDNAVKYSAEGTVVEVRLVASDVELQISVRDYGMGIPEEEMQRIFEAFTRLEKSSEVQGSGLGLFITRGIAERHGGHLTVESGPGKERARGAVFTLVLPRGVPNEAAPTESTTGA